MKFIWHIGNKTEHFFRFCLPAENYMPPPPPSSRSRLYRFMHIYWCCFCCCLLRIQVWGMLMMTFICGWKVACWWNELCLPECSNEILNEWMRMRASIHTYMDVCVFVYIYNNKNYKYLKKIYKNIYHIASLSGNI